MFSVKIITSIGTLLLLVNDNTCVHIWIGKTAVVKSAVAVLGVDVLEANCAKFVLGSDKQREQVCVFVFVCVRVCVCVRV